MAQSRIENQSWRSASHTVDVHPIFDALFPDKWLRFNCRRGGQGEAAYIVWDLVPLLVPLCTLYCDFVLFCAPLCDVITRPSIQLESFILQGARRCRDVPCH